MMSIARYSRGPTLSRAATFHFLLWISISSFAQTTTATISGAVADQNAALVAGAKITAKNINTNIIRSVTTDEAGRFLIPELAPGNYEVKAEHAGFSKEARRGIVLTVGREAVINLTLKVGSIADQLVITNDAPLVNTTSAGISSLVGERTIQDLPLNGRDLLQLATLQIGVINAGSLTTEPIDAGTGAVKMSINGGRINFNNFLLDGTSVNDPQNTTPGSVAGGFTGVDAIREFQLLTNNYSAEYGGAGGGIINIVSKSGTNEIHGTVFEFLRNSVFDARNFFDLENVPAFKRNQFGGSLGAPIRRDQTFIFSAYEAFRQRLAQTRRFFVPNDKARGGILPTGTVTISPAIKPYLDLYPRPNAGDAGGGLGVFVRDESGKINQDYFTIRVDHNFSTEDSFFARYTFDDSEQTDPDMLLQNSILAARNQYTGLGYTHTLSPIFVNCLRFGYNRSRVSGDDVDIIDIPKSLVFTPTAPTLGLFRQLGGLSPLADRLLVPRFLVLNTFEVSDQAIYTRGSHNMKFGFTGRRMQLNALSANTPYGGFLFGSYQAFLTGKPFLFAAPLTGADDPYRGIRQSLFASYVQDDWKAPRNLTFNLGLRYEFTTSPTEATDKISNLRDIFRDRKPTVGEPFFKNNTLKNFAPRFGFAWDINGNGKTSLRGGYGIFFAQPLPNNYRFEMSTNEPFFIIGIAINPPMKDAFTRLANLPGIVALQVYQFDPPPSYVQQWSLSLQREIIAGFILTAAYVGARGVHLPTNSNRNTSANFTILPGGEKQFPVGVRNPLRNPALATVRQTQHNGDSFYHGLQLNVERRLSKGLQIQMAYMFSKSIDTASDSVGVFGQDATQFAQDPYNYGAERGPSVFNVRHNFSIDALYQLPYKTSPSASGTRRVADFFFGRWQANTIITARSGTPFSPIITVNNSNDGNTDNVERPSWAPGFTSESAVTGNPNQYFNPKAFILAPPGRFGNVGRNMLGGPGLFAIDLSLVKVNNISEWLSVQFRAEAFNLLNRANFALPGTIEVFTQGGVVPPNVGRITRTSTSSRQLQFGLKLIF
jgi:Carboxypeptidase regulatory-like domain/TonB dependent receptor